MINLLPPDAKDALHTEYLFRLAAVYMALFSAVLLAVGALFLPLYVLINNEYDALVAEKDSAPAPADASVVEGTVSKTNELAKELERTHGQDSLAALIMAVGAELPAGATVSAYAAERAEGRIGELHVRGVAPSRDTLIAFRDALAARPEFERADIPLENLVEERDLPFELRITVADNAEAL